MTNYRCQFELFGLRREACSTEGLSDFREGFWLNDNLEFTKGGDAAIWIPPHKVEYIQAERDSDSGEVL